MPRGWPLVRCRPRRCRCTGSYVIWRTWSAAGSPGHCCARRTRPLFYDPAVQDSGLTPLDGADATADLRTWHEECERSRQHAARFDLNDTGLRDGQECSLRWIYTHMIEEYARHNGHADLLRELVDGAVGW